MTVRSGLNTQWGLATETNWGVPVTPTRFYPIIDPPIGEEIDRLESEAIIPGQRVLRSQQWSAGSKKFTGDVGMELYDRSLGLLFTHMFGGTPVTTGPVSGLYTHTFTPGELTSKSFTDQTGVVDPSDGTVRPLTRSGCKVTSWEIACSAGEIVTLGLSTVAKNVIRHRSVADGVTTNASAAITSATAAFSDDDVGKPITGTGIPAATTILSVTSATAATLSANATASGTGITFTIGVALATASYSSGISPMNFVGASVLVAGTSLPVHSVSHTGDNALKVDRDFLGTPLIDEPLEVGLRAYGGSLDPDYNQTQFKRYVDGVEAALVTQFSKGSNYVKITENVRFDGAPPATNGRDIATMSVPFVAVGPTTDAGAITVELVNGDSTP